MSSDAETALAAQSRINDGENCDHAGESDEQPRSQDTARSQAAHKGGLLRQSTPEALLGNRVTTPPPRPGQDAARRPWLSRER